MDQQQIVNDIYEINKRVCSDLWNLSNVNNKLSGLSPHLILPQKRDGSIRVSEQESRVLYCNVLNNLNYFYSIETPTEHTYQQTGDTPVSGSSDLSIFINNGQIFEKIINVEFKAHSQRNEAIRKDIEKLIREDLCGNWFHTLKNTNSGTFSKLFKKFNDSFQECSGHITNKLSFVFCFCVLDKKRAYIREFSFDPNHQNLSDYINDFFDPNCLSENNGKDGWTYIK